VASGRRGGVSGSGTPQTALSIKKDEIRSTRHVYRQTSVGHEVILLCNSAGTAVQHCRQASASAVMKLRDTVRSVSASLHPPRNGITCTRSVSA
jgi:hypothetical protein